MLTLWYIILGWKEYNKPFRKAEQPPKPADSVKKPDLIPQKKNVLPTPGQDSNKSEPSRSIPIDPKPPARQPDSSFFNSKAPQTPEITQNKFNPPTPKIPEIPKTPDLPKVPEPPRVLPRTPDPPKAPEPPNLIPETPKVPPRTPEAPKTPQTPRTPDPPKFAPAPPTPQTFVPEAPRTPEGLPRATPSRRPESVTPEFPASTVKPSPAQSEFPIPPYLPGQPQGRPLSRDDQLFAAGNAFGGPAPSRPSGDPRDLSYAKGEFPEVPAKVQEHTSRVPKYMEQSVISNPDSLESEEDDEDF